MKFALSEVIEKILFWTQIENKRLLKRRKNALKIFKEMFEKPKRTAKVFLIKLNR